MDARWSPERETYAGESSPSCVLFFWVSAKKSRSCLEGVRNFKGILESRDWQWTVWDLVLKRGIWLVIIVIGYRNTIPYIIEDSTSLCRNEPTVVCVPFFVNLFFLCAFS